MGHGRGELPWPLHIQLWPPCLGCMCTGIYDGCDSKPLLLEEPFCVEVLLYKKPLFILYFLYSPPPLSFPWRAPHSSPTRRCAGMCS